MPPADPPTRPLSVRRVGDGLRVDWADGASTFATWRHLRANCPCATCQDDRAKPPNPLRVLTPAEAAAGPPAPVAMTPVGYYAYRIAWNDGHDAGIYPVGVLRKLGTPVPPEGAS